MSQEDCNARARARVQWCKDNGYAGERCSRVAYMGCANLLYVKCNCLQLSCEATCCSADMTVGKTLYSCVTL